jgi:hypothetical protein
VDDYREAAIPIALPRDVVKAVVEALGDVKVIDGKDAIPLSEWVEAEQEEVDEAVAATIWKTMHGGAI